MNSNGINSLNQNKSSSLISLFTNIPLFVQLYILITLFLYLLNLFIKDISYFLSNITSKIIFQYQFWRLITSTFMTTNFSKIILGFLSWVKFASSLENTLGTIKYLIIFIINSFIIQILFCIFTFFSSFINTKKPDNSTLNKEINSIENNGLWGIIICELTLLCLNNPQTKIKILFFPCKVKAKYYPLVFYILLCLFDSFKIDLQIVSGVLYGIIYFYFLKNRIKISNSLINNIEDNYCFQFITKLKNFKKNKRNIRTNIIISNDRGVYSPVQITTSSNFHNNSINNVENNNNSNNIPVPINVE